MVVLQCLLLFTLLSTGSSSFTLCLDIISEINSSVSTWLLSPDSYALWFHNFHLNDIPLFEDLDDCCVIVEPTEDEDITSALVKIDSVKPLQANSATLSFEAYICEEDVCDLDNCYELDKFKLSLTGAKSNSKQASSSIHSVVSVIIRPDEMCSLGHSEYITTCRECHKEEDDPLHLRVWIPIIGILVAVAIFMLSGVLLARFIWSVKHKKTATISQVNNVYHISADEMKLKTKLDCPTDIFPGSSEEDGDYAIPDYEEDELYEKFKNTRETILRNSIQLENKLGSGQFGDVYKGKWTRDNGDIEVAVKVLKEDAGKEDKVKFLQEAAIMGQFKDPNVVTMYGVVTAGDPVLLILELLPKGDLRSYLLHHHPSNATAKEGINGHTLLSYCRQVVSGMVYLSCKQFVHRDLAARNILVSAQGICKIADFGMARDLLYETFYTSHGGMIPVKWTAPEALYYRKYSTASDVWSYGVLLYEIWSVGHKPFEGIDNQKVRKMIDSGYRLPPPPGCPRMVYSLMINCWHPDCTMRPRFEEVRDELSLPDTTLLQWNDEDSNSPDALRLGGSLQEGMSLFPDLQNMYKK